MTNVILCGGNGTRLWPISRELMPKQFVKLFDDKSLFELTYARNKDICKNIIILSNIEQYFLAKDSLINESSNNIRYLLEPIARNTAPAVTLACLEIVSKNKDEIVLITPSDHLIKDDISYKKAITKAQELAQNGHIVTFGIKPTSAHTGFGYIQFDSNTLDAISFKEKPNKELASKYLKEGNYYWNSGMFMFKAGVLLDEIEKYANDIYKQAIKAYQNANKDNKDSEQQMIRIAYEDMANIKEDSIDYAIMEKTNMLKVVPSDMGWSDVGSFDALYDELAKDKNNNTINKNHISINSHNNLILCEDRNISTIDIDDLIIVDTKDALLLSKKGSSQNIKQIVNKIKQNTNLHNIHLTGHRPWGSYTILDEDNGYKVKKIVVKPKHRISLQKHKHRNEHWVVIEGVATITLNDKTFDLKQNQSTYIKAGDVHRLANNTDKKLIIIEAQVGSYTGEDDIVRLDDDFNR